MQSVDKYMKGDLDIEAAANLLAPSQSGDGGEEEQEDGASDAAPNSENDVENGASAKKSKNKPCIRHVPNEDGMSGVIYLKGPGIQAAGDNNR